MEQRLSRKVFHICMVIVIIIAILFVVGILVLRYQVEGETNLPFNLSKITIISSIDATNNEDTTNRWNLNVSQNNDIYLYIEKNDDYGTTEIIKDIVINNFVINTSSEKGERNIYKPSQEGTTMFINSEENVAQEITYTGDMDSNIKELKIANQGGLVVLRLANDNIATYISNEGDQIDYSQLLKITDTSLDDLKATVSFDLTMNLESGRAYKASITLDVPVDNVIEEGTSSIEETDLEDIVFKRIENN